MKKISTLILSLAVAGSAMAIVPSAKFEKSARSFELSNAKIAKVEAVKTFGTDAATMKKAPAKAPMNFADVAGEYIFVGTMDFDDGSQESIGFNFEITTPDANGNVTIKNFFGNVFSPDPVNDLNAQLYNETLQSGEEITILKIGLAQDLFTNSDGIAVQPYLYGSYSGDGENWVYTQNEIEFFCTDDYLTGAYTSMGIYIGYIVGENGLRGYYPILGTGYYQAPDGSQVRNAVEGLKVNTIMTADQYTDETTTESAEFSINTLYSEEYEAIIMTGVGGSFEPMIWYIDQENMTARATDQMMGIVYDEQYNGYEVWAFDENVTDAYTVDGILSSDPATGNTIMTIPSQMRFACEMGWVEKFDNTVFKYDFNFLKNAGIDNVTVDSDNANKPVEYFNLQGVKVANPANGIYIRKQGTSVSKVLVK